MGYFNKKRTICARKRISPKEGESFLLRREQKEIEENTKGYVKGTPFRSP